jgi:hypothetical protein
MPRQAPPFEAFFETIFLESHRRLTSHERKAIDKAVRLLSADPRHLFLHVHKPRKVTGKYPSEGGNAVFIAYASKELRFTFEFGPRPDMISFRNCGRHDPAERRI